VRIVRVRKCSACPVSAKTDASPSPCIASIDSSRPSRICGCRVVILQLKIIVFEQKKLVSASENMSDEEDTVNNNVLRGKLSVLNCR